MSPSTDEFAISETSIDISRALHVRRIEKCLRRADGFIQSVDLSVIFKQKFTRVTDALQFGCCLLPVRCVLSRVSGTQYRRRLDVSSVWINFGFLYSHKFIFNVNTTFPLYSGDVRIDSQKKNKYSASGIRCHWSCSPAFFPLPISLSHSLAVWVCVSHIRLVTYILHQRMNKKKMQKKRNSVVGSLVPFIAFIFNAVMVNVMLDKFWTRTKCGAFSINILNLTTFPTQYEMIECD